MSLGDELRFLRAKKGGMSTQEIAEAIGLPKVRILNEIEQRYRMVGDDETLHKLAEYFGVPFDQLAWHRERYRKALSGYLQAILNTGEIARFQLRTGEFVEGRVLWWDLGAFCLQHPDEPEPKIVQRHVVIDWDRSRYVEQGAADEEAHIELVEG